MTDIYRHAAPCPLDVLENEGGPTIDHDIADEYGIDLRTARIDTLMSARHEGLALTVGYAATGEDYPD